MSNFPDDIRQHDNKPGSPFAESPLYECPYCGCVSEDKGWCGECPMLEDDEED